jgi:HAD superfamily hydrolase (TIGR01509 family)
MLETSNSMKPKFGVLWDLDGVIVDTREFHFTTWAMVLREHKIELSRAEFDSVFGMNNADTLTRVTGSPQTPEMVQEIGGRKEELFRNQIRGHLEPLPGVALWLDQFHRRGWPQAVASSAPIENIESIIEDLGFREFFSTMVSGQFIPGKPNPDVFLEAANLINISPDKCIVIEDAVVGVQAAKRAGMFCVAVTTYKSREDLRQADRIVHSLELLPDDFYPSPTS